jgi:hypothetical protein
MICKSAVDNANTLGSLGKHKVIALGENTFPINLGFIIRNIQTFDVSHTSSSMRKTPVSS